MGKKAVILTAAELHDLIASLRKLAMIYAILGHPEDKEAIYAQIEVYEKRIRASK